MIRDSRVEFSAAGVAFALCLLFGSGWFSTRLLAYAGVLNVPTALGVPVGLPGFRLWPLGATDWWYTGTETLAASVFTAAIFGWLTASRRRRPDASVARLFGSGWAATILAAMTANVIRVVVTGFVSQADVNVYLGVAGAALGSGLLWGVVTGWCVGLAAAVARRFETRDDRTRPAPTG